MAGKLPLTTITVSSFEEIVLHIGPSIFSSNKWGPESCSELDGYYGVSNFTITKVWHDFVVNKKEHIAHGCYEVSAGAA
jgi:hypothetical protein